MDDDTFLPWVAGFFDGEGCVSVLRSSRANHNDYNHRLFVSLTQQDNRALIQVKDRFGGSLLCDQNRGQTGGYKRHLIWRWRAHNSTAYDFLQTIAPYCMVKDRQVTLALEWPEPYVSYVGRPVPRHVWTKRNEIMLALKEARQSVKELADA